MIAILGVSSGVAGPSRTSIPGFTRFWPVSGGVGAVNAGPVAGVAEAITTALAGSAVGKGSDTFGGTTMLGCTLTGIFARPGKGGPIGTTGGKTVCGAGAVRTIGGPTGTTGGKADGGSEAAGTTAGPTGGSSATVCEPGVCMVGNTGG